MADKQPTEQERALAEYLESQQSRPAPSNDPVEMAFAPAEETASAEVHTLPPPGSPERERRRSKKGGGGGKAPATPREFKPLPRDCPVRCLGVNGSTYSFLDALGQFVEKSEAQLTQAGVDDLFKTRSAQVWLEDNFPRIGKGGEQTGIDRDLARRALMAECGELSRGGKFVARERVREAGAWVDGKNLWLHQGDSILCIEPGERKPVELEPGMHGRMVYPLGARQPRLADAVDSRGDGEQSPVAALLELLKAWQFQRGDLDRALLLGWIACAIFGGALQWRPAVWVTGGKGTGKSTLQRLIMILLGGEEAMIEASDTSGAGIWQSMERQSLPVVLDEVEADADNRKRMGIVELMRQAASGGKIRRGGSDHKPIVFTARGCFYFTSINMLPVKPQDLSRLCHFELLPLAEGAAPPHIDEEEMAEIGRRIRRRVVMSWANWRAQLGPWWDAINREVGRDGQRAADVYGTMLAMQHLLQWETAAEDSDIQQYSAELVPYLKLRAEQTGSDSERMLKRLLTKTVDVEDKDVKVKAGLRSLVYLCSGRADGLEGLKSNDPEADLLLPPIGEIAARRTLGRYGIQVVTVRAGTKPKPGQAQLAPGPYLAIALDHSELNKLFDGTEWGGGVWTQSAGRFEGAGKRKAKITQDPDWATLVPLDYALGKQETDDQVAE